MRSRWKWWRYNEILALLDLWAEVDVKDGFYSKRNRQIYGHISEMLKKRGVSRNANQIREKMKTLRRAYGTFATSQQKINLGDKRMLIFNKLDGILNSKPQLDNSSEFQPSLEEKKPPMRQRKRPLKFQEDHSPSLKRKMVREKQIEGFQLFGRQHSDDMEDDERVTQEFMANSDVEEDDEDRATNQMGDPDGPSMIPLIVETNVDNDDEITIETVVPSHMSPLHLNFDSDSILVEEESGSPDGSSRYDCGKQGQGSSRCGGFGIPVEFIAERMMDRFLDAQTEMEKRFLALEEKRMKEETRLTEKQQQQDAEFLSRMIEIQERRLQEDTEQDRKLFTLLGELIQQGRKDSKKGNKQRDNCDTPSKKCHTKNWEFSGTFRPAKPPISPSTVSSSLNSA